ncbi:putative disease resistance protein RGA3 [Quercus lobata]|uniref:putative disease resistance protein RGA3 n=1 Tax=Quercus lobata TaxID=97700 RepID=UPI001248B401|nr:putative disease resistance protein RGA3 [Quercus lobata]
MAWALVSTIKDQLSSFITSEFMAIANVKEEVQKLESKAMLNDAKKRQWNTVMIKAEVEKQEKQEEEKEKAETSTAKKRKEKNFFLVFDDVWIEDYAMWKPFRDALKYCGSQSSRILVTTCKDKVAEMMESAHITNLGILSKEDCWLVFSKIAFYGKNYEDRNQLEDIGMEIAKECKGLPLAAKTLGSLLRFKRSREQWEMVLCSSLWGMEDVERGLFAP